MGNQNETPGCYIRDTVETEDMYNGITGPIPIGREEEPPLYVECADKACKNTGLDAITQAQGVNRKQDESIIIDNHKDDTDGNLV